MKTITYEGAMAAGVVAQARGAHRHALRLREIAFRESSGDIEAARALRDGAASHGYLGEFDQALLAAEESVAILDTYNVRRELGASLDRLGRVQTLVAMQDEFLGLDTGVSDDALESFRRAKELLPDNDQYFVNMIGRSAVAHALYSSRSAGIDDARRACQVVQYSETKKKSFTVAAVSLGLSVALGSSPRGDRANSRRFKLAQKFMR